MDCSICLEKIKIEEYPVHFCCKQTYHFNCIKTWTDEKYTCPICRKLLDRRILNVLRNIQNNIRELELKEKRAHHIIETLMLDIQNIKDRTRENFEKLANTSSYTQHPLIPSSPVLSNDEPLSFRRLYERRGAVVLPLIIPSSPSSPPSSYCAAPAFCRCFNCSDLGLPRWN